VLGFAARCTDEKQEPLVLTGCQPEGSSITLTEGLTQEFSCDVEASSGETGFHFRWLQDGSEAGENTLHTFFACGEGEHTVTLEVTDDAGNTVTREWSVALTPSSVDRPSCFSESLARLRAGNLRIGFNDSAADEAVLTEIQTCLHTSLAENVCSVEGNYGLALADLALWSLASRNRQQSGGLDREVITELLEHTLSDIRDQFTFVRDFTGPDFEFFIEDNFLVRMNDDDPDTELNESLTINFFGVHDLGEVNYFLSEVYLFIGMFSVSLAYNGIIEAMAGYPEIYQPIYLYLEREIIPKWIERLESDPAHLTLTGPNGEEGKRRLRDAQKAFVLSLRDLNRGFAHVIEETKNQAWNLIRYWDCGSDGVCPPGLSNFPDGDPAEPYEDCGGDGICPEDPNYEAPDDDGTEGNGERDSGEEYEDLNLNGRWNDSYSVVGPDINGTEGNGKFESGEPVGTEIALEQGTVGMMGMLGLLGVFGQMGQMGQMQVMGPGGGMMPNTMDPQITIRINELVAKNIEGPDPLRFSDFAAGMGVDVTEEQIKTFLFEGFGIPYPEVRISEFFVNPTDLRRMFPLYDRGTEEFIVTSECEPYYDWGYDWIRSDQEVGYDPESNPDPSHDDLDQLENMDDGIDNDRDGEIDEYSSMGFPTDLGVEGNIIFDWVDTNGNLRHDAGEMSEKFDDVGVGPGSFGAGNGAWDCQDRDHSYPSGPNVGGGPPEVSFDPRNTTLHDQSTVVGDTEDTWAYMQTECINFHYLFFPDPTFSDIIVFPEDIVNVDGVQLNKHAKLHRSIAKALEFLLEMGFAD